ncbi:hypothetical protein D3C73_1526570 [compost metagenome]
MLWAQQPRVQCLYPIHRGGAEQFQSIVIDRDGKRQRLLLADSPRQQTRQAQMHLAAGEGIQEKVPALTGLQRFGQQ